MFTSNRAFAAALITIFVVALGLRLGLAAKYVGLDSPPDFDANPDQIDYEMLAHRVSSGAGYTLADGSPTARRSPGTSWTLAPIYAVTGRSFIAGRIWFCLISAATCLAVAWIAVQIAGRGAAVASAALLAIYPGHAYYAMHFVSEVPYCFCLALGVAATMRAWRGARLGGTDKAGSAGLSVVDSADAPTLTSSEDSACQCHPANDPANGFAYLLLAGLCFGFAILCRTQLTLLVPLAFVALIVFYRKLPRAQWQLHMRRVAVQLAVIAAVLSPWLIRNTIVFGKPVLSNIAGLGLYGAHNPITFNDPNWRGTWIKISELERQFGALPMDEVLKDEEAKRRGLHATLVNLPRLPQIALYKLGRFVWPFMDTPNRVVQWTFALAWIAVIPLIFIGGRFAWRTARRPTLLLLLPVLSTVAAIVLFYGSVRFRDSIAPLFITFAGIGVARAAAVIAARFTSKTSATSDADAVIRLADDRQRKAA